MSFCTTRHVKSSRKIKDCYWCGQMILVGNPKVYISTLIEGDFSDVNLHPECFDASNRWQDKNKFEDSWPEYASMERGTTKTKWETTDEHHDMMNVSRIQQSVKPLIDLLLDASRFNEWLDSYKNKQNN